MPHRTSSPSGEDPVLEPIAICGMACHLPGGVSSPSSFWDMLVKKQSGQTSRVPESRFNIDAYYHSNLERPGSFNVPGGYFLDGKPEDFDPTAFNITPIEAQWLDPQQRKVLEVSYECLESAGLSLDSVAGSNTAVFVGSFTSDYQQMSIRDPDFRHNYAATGVDPGIISNRIGNTFNLKGPSFTINTACSSSIYAIHNAANVLRARDCDAAIVAGVNLIITVDQHMNTAKLGILSPTSTCHTFDAAADGYGRAEGAGALYMKRLQDAIRDGDPIRGVIRASAVNTNGKVEGMGITHPSSKGQESVVRMAYEKAGLSPNATAYAELHGTGTPVGDPIEARAIASAMNDTRSPEKPLFLGAVKPNIGHSEAASGIFAVMKAALMTEAGVMPGVAHFQKLNPAIKEDDWNVKVNVDTKPWPEEFAARRASVSSFGYGGTNGHVIIESVESLYPWYQHARAKRDAPYTRSHDRPFLLCFSAHDKATLARNITAISEVSGDYYVADLAYTLNLNRTQWSHRGFAIASDTQDSAATFDKSTFKSGVASPVAPEVGFLFTGQGAQWAGMGRVAAATFPSFLQTIQRLDNFLGRLDRALPFRLVDLVRNEVQTISANINEPDIAQPFCTAVQIALVDLFTEWGMNPVVSVGHSSGEIAAAYAAGLLSAPEAMLAAYCRGKAVRAHSNPGSMLAIGLGADGLDEYLAPFAPDQVCIACENSPSSVTLSGMTHYIQEIKEKFDADKVFARELKTGRAYHSSHMESVGVAYDRMLTSSLAILKDEDLSWRRPRSAMISSVTGDPVDMETDALPSSYWSSNLRSRVLFNTAVRRLGTDLNFQQVKCLVEIGPHSALEGPFKQVCRTNAFDRFLYVPSLVRNKNDATQLLSVAGSLFVANYPVSLEAVNAIGDEGKMASSLRKPKSHRLLVDLPPYQWNYDRRHWAEPRASAEQRNLVQPRHDLLGRQIPGLSTHSRVWRNVLRQRDIPWLKDHSLGGAAIFPAAGHMSLAVEALRQVAEEDSRLVGQVILRDVDISTALVIPENDTGVEIVLRLDQQPSLSGGNSTSWYAFSVESLSEGRWISHCRGQISTGPEVTDKYQHPVTPSLLTQRVSGQRWYEALRRVGFQYGPTFQQLCQVRTDRQYQHAEAEVRIQNRSDVVQDESRYVVHPATVDTCLQLIIISIHRGKHKEMPWGVVPIRLEEVTLRFPRNGEGEGSIGTAVAWTDNCEGRYFNTHTQLMAPSGRVLVDVKGLRCVAYEAAIPADVASNTIQSAPFGTISWKPDILRLRKSASTTLRPIGTSEAQVLASLIQMIHHRHPLTAIIVCGQQTSDMINMISAVLPESCIINTVPANELLSEIFEGRNTAIAGPVDLVLIDESVSDKPEVVTGLSQDYRWLIQSQPAEGAGAMHGVNNEDTSYQVLEFPVADPLAGTRLARLFSHDHISLVEAGYEDQSDVTIVHQVGRGGDDHLVTSLSSKALSATTTSIDQFTLQASRERKAIIIDDRHGTFLNSLDGHSFEALKSLIRANLPTVWLTRGVRQGACVFGGMIEGFLRVIRSEQASTRIVLLDVDQETQPADMAEAIQSVLHDAATKDSGKDTEFWLHKGMIHIPRVVPNYQLNTEWSPPGSLTSRASEIKPLPEGVRLKSSIVDGQLIWSYDEPETSTVLRSNEIEIQVLASELSMNFHGRVLVSGRVIRCGPAVRADLAAAGDQVLGWTTESFATVVRTTCFVRWYPTTNDAPKLLAGVAALAKGVSMCLATARISSNDRICILPGPVAITHAVLRLGRAMGWHIHLVASNPDERQQFVSDFECDSSIILLADDMNEIRAHLRVNERRWVILAHDFSPLSQEVWRNLPARSVFILNETPLESALDPTPLSRGASFIPTSIRTLDATSASQILQQTLDLIWNYPELADNVDCVHDISELNESAGLLRENSSSEGTVVTYRYHESRVRVMPAPPHLVFSPDASYLLVGCLGGLGRSLIRFMIERGARNFAFVSRTGTDKPEAASIVDFAASTGGSVQVFRADAASESDMIHIVRQVHAERPLRGVVHAAMVLRDAVFEQMNCNQFQAAVNPKVQGAMSISKALLQSGVFDDLDFFVMTSSISATLGNPGQSNYSAANSFLDTLAWQHRLQNRPGVVSLVLPMVLDVGVVAESTGLETSLLRKGMYGIDEQEMLRGFEVAMSRRGHSEAPLLPLATASSKGGQVEVADAQIILGLEPSQLAKAIIHSAEGRTDDCYWYADARFVHLRAEVERIIGQTASSTSSGSGGLQSLLANIGEVESTGRDEILTVIAQFIAQRVSRILLIAAEDFDLDGPSVASYGLDSMIGAEMRNWLFKEFGLEVTFQDLLSPSLTFKGLAEMVAVHQGVLVHPGGTDEMTADLKTSTHHVTN